MAERWNLLELGKECEHDWVYEEANQSDDLVSDLLWRGRETAAFFLERETQTEYKQMMVKKYMEANQGGVWWDFKMKTRCLTCKAIADDTTLEETRTNHIARKSRKDVARANAWKKTTETNKLEWQLADIGHYNKVTGDEEATDGENIGGPRQLCCKEKRRRNRKYMLVALVGVHDIFAEIADLMLAKFADMKEAWKASKEWCEVLEKIRNGELRDEEDLAAEKNFPREGEQVESIQG